MLVNPENLQLLMRYEEIHTTSRFCIGLDADAVADEHTGNRTSMKKGQIHTEPHSIFYKMQKYFFSKSEIPKKLKKWIFIDGTRTHTDVINDIYYDREIFIFPSFCLRHFTLF